jgi:D-arabinose 1-dehydrogenase-like Zn-dependent alcohol dehydrogenase
MTSLPATYKAASFQKANESLTIVDLQLNLPAAGEVLVKVIAVGICYSDHLIQTGDMGNPFPRAPGHEVIGNIVAVGNNVNRWKIGDRVGAGWHGG